MKYYIDHTAIYTATESNPFHHEVEAPSGHDAMQLVSAWQAGFAARDPSINVRFQIDRLATKPLRGTEYGRLA